jgi:hypothetical protein
MVYDGRYWEVCAMTNTTACCGENPFSTGCQAGSCAGQICPNCGAGCDLNTPRGQCENVLRHSDTWSDAQAAEINTAIGPDGQQQLIELVFNDIRTVLNLLESARHDLRKVMA